jgi:hypothetical protein
MLSDNVSACGSDSSFFDPPIEYFRVNNSGGLNSGDGIVMRKSNSPINPSNYDDKTSEIGTN